MKIQLINSNLDTAYIPVICVEHPPYAPTVKNIMIENVYNKPIFLKKTVELGSYMGSIKA